MLAYVANYLTYKQYSFYEVLQSIVIKTFSYLYFFEVYFTMIRLRLKKTFSFEERYMILGYLTRILKLENQPRAFKERRNSKDRENNANAQGKKF